MAVNSIIQQPAPGSLHSAYRPVINRVEVGNDQLMYFFVTSNNANELFVFGNHLALFTPAVGGQITLVNAGDLTGTYNVTAAVLISVLGSPAVKITTPSAPADKASVGVSIQVNGNPIYDALVKKVPPVVYCDIYVNGVYYKSQSKTHPISTTTNTSTFEFDVSIAAQEVLRYDLPVNGGPTVLIASNTMKSIFCRFRSSSFDHNGFIRVDTPEPKQGTGLNAPVSGGGTQGNTFFVVNSALQHEDNQDLAAHLSSYKTGTWANNAYPLTHRPNPYKLCLNDSDYFPILAPAVGCVNVRYRLKGAVGFTTATNCSACQTPTLLLVENTGLAILLHWVDNPNYVGMTVQHSTDQITWNDATTGPTSPGNIGSFLFNTGDVYFRVFATCAASVNSNPSNIILFNTN